MEKAIDAAKAAAAIMATGETIQTAVGFAAIIHSVAVAVEADAAAAVTA
ncbi:MAG: hypothetical protein U1E61_02625 [Bradyrhizobium sp.]